MTHDPFSAEGPAIARELGLRYEGPQTDPRGHVFMMFTDVHNTRTSFMAGSLDHARRRLMAARARFSAAAKRR